jgi:hypothetical protein
MAIKPVESAKSGLVDLIKIVLLIVILIALIAWAKTNPAAAQATLNKVMNTLALIISKLCDWITSSLS